MWPRGEALKVAWRSGRLGLAILGIVASAAETEIGGQAIPESTFATYCIGEGSFYGEPNRIQAVVDLHLGGLGLVEVASAVPLASGARGLSLNGCQEIIAGCTVVDGRPSGDWRSFDGWSPDSRKALFTAQSCSKRMESNRPAGAL